MALKFIMIYFNVHIVLKNFIIVLNKNSLEGMKMHHELFHEWANTIVLDILDSLGHDKSSFIFILCLYNINHFYDSLEAKWNSYSRKLNDYYGAI